MTNNGWVGQRTWSPKVRTLNKHPLYAHVYIQIYFQAGKWTSEIAKPQVSINSNISSIDCKKLQPKMEICNRKLTSSGILAAAIVAGDRSQMSFFSHGVMMRCVDGMSRVDVDPYFSFIKNLLFFTSTAAIDVLAVLNEKRKIWNYWLHTHQVELTDVWVTVMFAWFLC